MGDSKKGVKFVQKFAKYMIDDTRRNEQTAKLLMMNKQTNKALENLEQLLRLNSSNKSYYQQILEAKGIDLNN